MTENMGGNEMQMSDTEILSSFREAKDQKKQIGVLADLNAVSPDEMQRYLHELGAPVQLPREDLRKAQNSPKATFDVSRALELHAEGLCDLDIAERLGVKTNKFAAWRRGYGLPANIRRKTGNAKNCAQPKQVPSVPGASTTMTAGRLADVFSRIAKFHPDALVTMNGKGVVAVMLSSVFNNVSDAEVQVFLMEE